jgi:cell division protein FtsW
VATIPRTAAPPVASRDLARPGQTYDGGVLLLASVLMTFGVAMVYSASMTVRGAELDWHQWWNTPLRQCVFAFAGFLVMLLTAHCNYRWLAWVRGRDVWRVGALYVLAVVTLIAVQIIGRETLGAQRALIVLTSPFVLSFQPAELAKVIMVIWLAALLGRMQDRAGGGQRRGGAETTGAGIRNFTRGFVPAVLSCGLLIGLTGLEDFGTAALMGVVMVMMLLIAGARWRHLLLLALIGLAGGAGLIAMKPYRLERLKTYLCFFDESRPAPDPQKEGYQIDQSMLAIGSGGWFGRGLGAGIQKYGYLPQKDNDFILAMICEELGVAGGIVVVLLFLFLLWRGWDVTRAAPDSFGMLLAAGLTLLIGLQAAFNVGVVTNSVPTKGISLPFVSAGGSGVVFLGWAAGLLAGVGRCMQARGGKHVADADSPPKRVE